MRRVRLVYFAEIVQCLKYTKKDHPYDSDYLTSTGKYSTSHFLKKMNNCIMFSNTDDLHHTNIVIMTSSIYVTGLEIERFEKIISPVFLLTNSDKNTIHNAHLDVVYLPPVFDHLKHDYRLHWRHFYAHKPFKCIGFTLKSCLVSVNHTCIIVITSAKRGKLFSLSICMSVKAHVPKPPKPTNGLI